MICNIIQKLSTSFFRVLNDFFIVKLEKVKKSTKSSQELVFIIGAPRTGSTYLSQLVISSMDVGYFTNLHHKFYSAPYVANYLLRFFRLERNDFNYNSNFGYVTGVLSESEGGKFWRRFFNHDKEHEELSINKMIELEHAIDLLLHSQKFRYFLFKNNYNSFRLSTLNRLFPNAKYLFITRDCSMNALSLVNARKSILGSDELWWSMIPKNTHNLFDIPVVEQVVEQVLRINEQINDDIYKLNLENQVLRISYEMMTSDPNLVVSDVAKFLGLDIKDGMDYSKTVNKSKAISCDTLKGIRNYLNVRN